MSVNVGPLTTLFTPAAPECISSLCFKAESGLTGINLGLPGTSQSTCLPTSYDWSPSSYYSPAICPSGHSDACRETATIDDVEVTIATCCPTSWGCRQTRASDQKLACTSSFAATTTTEISSYEIGSSGSSIKTAAITTVISAGEIAYAYGIIVRRASDDPTWPTRDNAATSTSKSTGTTVSTSTTSSAAAASDGDSSSSGLSTGAKAGIGVGASIGGLLILAACAGGFLMLRRRRRRRAYPTAQLGVDETPRELHAESVQELPAENREGWKRERATELSST